MKNNITRLFVENQLDIDSSILLSHSQSHYLMNVMRKQIKDHIKVFNGKDGEWLSEIIHYNKKLGVEISLKEKLRKQENLPELWLIFTPIKQSRLHFILEKSAELGVTKMFPILTSRTVISNINLEKSKLVLVEAAEQSNRLDIPVIYNLQKLDTLISNWNPDNKIVLCNESETHIHIRNIIHKLDKDICTIMIGPEGGFTSQELDYLGKLPFLYSVSLGAQILRSETAAISSLACIQMMRK
ncbi:Ribosomal RNA small subunit methyltransferase E [Rickettsiales bacterium Ac37b]|nr:Ribosomal RNA small subunit methyltransferase E [Rickettsiales bacterium Ac37b]